jgi:autotransporter-associated beta strand protein
MTSIGKTLPCPSAASHCKRNYLRSFDGLLAASALLAASLGSANAADYTWDTSTAAGITAGSGAWSTTGTNWNNGSTSVVWSQTSATVASHNAIFAGTDGTYTVTLSGTTNAQSVTFNNGGYTLTSGTLTLRPTGTTNGNITVAAGKTATINSPIGYSGNTTANITINSGGTLNLGGGASNAQYTFAGSGTANMTSGTYSANIGNVGNATLNQTSGTFNITPGNAVGYTINSGTQNVAYNLSGGTLSVIGLATGTSAHFGIGTATGTAFTSALNVSGSGALVTGTGTAFGEIQIAKAAASNGTLNVSGGTVTVGSGTANNEIYFFKAGASAGYTANLTQSGGTVTANGIQFGGTAGTYDANSSANLTLSGGTLYVGLQGISRGSGATALPVAIKLQGGTIGASDDWSSSLDMKLGTTGGGPAILAATSSGTSKDITLSGILSDDTSVNGRLTKTGAGTVTLSGSNTFSGGLTVRNGTVNAITSSNALGSGTVSMGGAGSTGATLTIGRTFANNFTINAPDSGSVVIAANGGGSGYTLSGGIALNNASLTLQTFDNVISGSTRASSIITGGVTGTGNLLLNNLGARDNIINISGSSVNHTGSITLSGTAATGDTTISAPIGANVTSVTQNSATSRLVLSGSNAYTGATTINAGTLALGASNVLPNLSAVSIGAATLNAVTFTDTAGTLDPTGAATINLGAGATLAFADSSGVNWSGGTLNITGTFVSGTSLRFGTSSAGLTSAQLNSITAGGIASFALNSDGYLIDAPPPELVANDAVVGFASAVSGSTTFELAGSATSTITLTFSINNAGVIALDASTNATNSTFSTAVNAWDNSNVGSVADAALLGKTFNLTGTASGGGNLTVTGNNGGGIGIQGENSNRVDGLNYGTGGATSTPETLTWTLSAQPGLSLSFKNWSYVAGALSDIRVSNGTTNTDFANLVGTTGTSALSNFQLSDGESLTFKEIPDMATTDGAGISGFSFEVIPAAINEYLFDNGGGNNLWTNSTNWYPNGAPASTADAIIDGYNVILNTAASSSIDELRIPNGSLTLSGTGALSMRAMTIGRDLTKTVRLVMDGSGVSFAYNGSSATDEFAVGSGATVETKPNSGGSEPLELGVAKLVLDTGAQWIVDGTNAGSLAYNIGDRLVLANFGSFTGSTHAIRARNFDLPSNRCLKLVATGTTIYYEVASQAVPTGPNIIIINTDDQAADQHFSFDGRTCITPTLQSLVDTGIKFNAAFCASSVCGSSRYALLTSRWPSRNTSDNFITRYPLGTLGRFGVSDTELERDGQNIGAWLQQAGYRTGFVGKSHVLDDKLNFTSNWGAKGLITYAKTANPETDAAVNAAMQHNHRIVCQDMRALGFDYVDGFYHANLKELYSDKLNVHNQEWLTSRALKFIDENRSERFFLYMAPTLNHGPVNDTLTTDLRSDPRFTSAGFLPNEDYSFMPTRQAIIDEVKQKLGITNENTQKDKLITARETWLDYSVKAIIDRLTTYGIRNDTLIIFTSDHGEKTLSTPLIWGKTSLYDLGLKVPMVMNWPNGITNPGRSYNELISHVDIGTTLLALTGASNLPTRPMDGVSLAPVFAGSSAAVRDDVFGEIGYARGVRTKTRKYIAVRYKPDIYAQIALGTGFPESNLNSQPTGGTVPRPYYLDNTGLGAGVATTNPTYFDDDQLYNLSTDPNENTNIYGQEPATAYDLKKRLAYYIGSIPDRPFRKFSDSSREFSPKPTSAPTQPGSGSVAMAFNSLNQVQLTWTDAANSELGYVIRKTVNGGTPVIVGEYPPGTTTAAVNLDSGVEDILLQVASYNEVGDTAVNKDLLSPEPWRDRTFYGVSKPSWSSDADGDGVTMLMEYAAGTNPLSASSVARPEMRMTTESSNRFLEYVLPRSSRRGTQFRGAVSTDLSTWQSGSPHCTIVETGTSQMIFRSATPVSGAARQFIRAEMIDAPTDQP